MDGLVQEYLISKVLAVEVPQFHTKVSTQYY